MQRSFVGLRDICSSIQLGVVLRSQEVDVMRSKIIRFAAIPSDQSLLSHDSRSLLFSTGRILGPLLV
jgi:hypothetical protein